MFILSKGAWLEMKKVTYRACRVSDLCSDFWGLFNYGLANHRGTETSASFTEDGYTTHGLATSESPLVAFLYGCMQAGHGHEIAVFAIQVQDEVARVGSVKLQALSRGIDVGAACIRSVDEQCEVVLPNVKRSDILGYYTLKVNGGIYSLNAWSPVLGDFELQSISMKLIEAHVSILAKEHAGQINETVRTNEINRLMGGR